MYNVFRVCHMLGMKKKEKVSESLLSALTAKLRENPELFASVAQVVELSTVDESGMQFADLEERLVPKIRQLGQSTMRSWVESVEAEAAAALKASDPTVKQREKKR